MRIVLLSGLGPVWPAASSFYDSDNLEGTLFDRKAERPPFHSGLDRRLGMQHFAYKGKDELIPLIRLRLDAEPHLTTEAVTSILETAGYDYELFRLEDVWDNELRPKTSPDVISLSMTYIVNMRSMQLAVEWVEENFPSVLLIAGGQYSNLKYSQIMEEFPAVDFIVKGDAEVSFPSLLAEIGGGGAYDKIPKLVWAEGKGTSQHIRINKTEYIDLDAFPSPEFQGNRTIVPYESMRGCPFTCKFCSFPAASPLWRYKSSEKIISDWLGYAEKNNSQPIRAMDSTFTVPPKRLRQLLKDLPQYDVQWEAYSRANVLTDQETIDGLEASNCITLSIGFESMSDNSLKYMNKAVHSTHNRKSHELLLKSNIDFRCSFMIGYPGETVEDYQVTHDYLVDEFERHIVLSVFSLTDEQMPVWDDAEKFKIQVADFDDPDYDWSHSDMDVKTARALHQNMFREVRWKNEKAVSVLWQIPYQLPIMPERSTRDNYRVEKLLERLAFAPKDYRHDQDYVRRLSREIVRELTERGIVITDETAENQRDLMNPMSPVHPVPQHAPV
jgi:radical SAM superfamily enzyme YgiQ (UPF0313 family)